MNDTRKTMPRVTEADSSRYIFHKNSGGSIPAAILNAATKAICAQTGRSEDFDHLAEAETLARAALEAAGVPAMIDEIERRTKANKGSWSLYQECASANEGLVMELAEIHESYTRVLAEQCAPDERHCACVPALRERIAELEADLEVAIGNK